MNFDPKTYIALAEHLNDSIDDLPDGIGAESARRTAVNRFYYGIYIETHLFLVNNIKDIIYQNDPNKTHGLLRTHLYAIDSREARKLTADLNKLFMYRRKADYDYPLSMKVLRMIVRTQRHIVNEAQKKLDLLLAAHP